MIIAVLLGGKSGEHEVSLVSGLAIAKALAEKHQVHLLGISREGNWHELSNAMTELTAEQARNLQVKDASPAINPIHYLKDKKVELVFPALHGPFGEDGIIQGFLESIGLPYVGCGVLASSLAMDKDMAKKVFEAAHIPVVRWLTLHRNDYSRGAAIKKWILEKLRYPIFIKPANMGSSVGISKVKSDLELEDAIEKAFKYDRKILIEAGLQVRELECAVLGNKNPKVSGIAEIKPHHEFYSYEAKYLDENGAELLLEAEDLTTTEIEDIKSLAIKAFKAIEGRGLARVDFFMEKDSRKIFLNEINTLPGFTPISMYPKLWGAMGMSFSELCEELVSLAQDEYREKQSLISTI